MGLGGPTLDRGSPEVGGGGGTGQLFGRGAGSPAGARVAASRPVPFPTDALKLPRTRKGILGGGGGPPS